MSSEELGESFLCGRRVLVLCASKVKLPLSVSLELPLCSPRLYILGIIPSALVSLSAWGYNTFLAMIQKASIMSPVTLVAPQGRPMDSISNLRYLRILLL